MSATALGATLGEMSARVVMTAQLARDAEEGRHAPVPPPLADPVPTALGLVEQFAKANYQPREPLNVLVGTPIEHWYARLAEWKQEVIKTIEALPEPEAIDDAEALRDMAAVERAVKTTIEALRQGQAPAVRLPGKEARNALIGYAIKVINGGVQDAATARAAVRHGVLSAEQVVADFRNRWSACQAIVLLRDRGALNPLFEAGSASGLGIAPAVAALIAAGIVVAIIGVAAVGALATIVIDGRRVTAANKELKDNLDRIGCFDPGAPPALKVACAKAAGKGHENLLKNQPQVIPWGKIITYGAIGVGVVATIYLLPAIVRSVMGASAEYRRGRTLASA